MLQPTRRPVVRSVKQSHGRNVRQRPSPGPPRQPSSSITQSSKKLEFRAILVCNKLTIHLLGRRGLKLTTACPPQVSNTTYRRPQRRAPNRSRCKSLTRNFIRYYSQTSQESQVRRVCSLAVLFSPCTQNTSTQSTDTSSAHIPPLLSTLTPSQKSFVELPVESDSIILAGPGTGKTHCIAARLIHMATQLKIPMEHILVLSSSEKTVTELRRLVDMNLPISAGSPNVRSLTGITAKLLAVRATAFCVFINLISSHSRN